jgi:4-amino-4-deoxy-L-arabinose transferase-like glycosyltransferase
MKGRTWWMALAALTLLAAALRLGGLGSQPLWEDEAQTYWIATQPLAGLVHSLSRDCSPPLYYLLVHLWARVGSSGEAWLRLPSAIFGIVTVPCLALVARRLGGNHWVGLGSALVLAISPLHIWHSQEARMYTLLALLSLASVWSLWEWRRGGNWVPYAIITVLALYTHHFALYLLAAEVIWLFAAGPPRRWPRALVLGVFCYVPGAALLWIQAGVNRTGGWIGKPPWDALPRTFGLLSLGVHADERLVVKGTPLLLIAGAAVFVPAFVMGVRWWLKRSPSLVWFTLAVPAVAFAVSLVVPSYTTGRYDVMVLGLYLLTVAGSMTGVRRFLILSSLIAVVEVVPVTHYFREYEKAAWRSIAQHVTGREREGDLVVVAPEIHYSPFKYYYRGLLTVLALPHGAPGGVVDYAHYARRWEGQDPIRATRLVREAMSGGRVFLVWSPYKGTLLFRDRLLERFRLVERLTYRTGSGYLELNLLEPRTGNKDRGPP